MSCCVQKTVSPGEVECRSRGSHIVETILEGGNITFEGTLPMEAILRKSRSVSPED